MVVFLTGMRGVQFSQLLIHCSPSRTCIRKYTYIPEKHSRLCNNLHIGIQTVACIKTLKLTMYQSLRECTLQ